jgi:hypothetical protein
MEADDILAAYRSESLHSLGGAEQQAADERCLAALSQFLAQPAPVAWIRKHPDGTLSDEMLPNWQIEAVRKQSGAWLPLYGSQDMSGSSIDS